MSHDIKIHDAQTAILRELLFKPVAGYAELQKPTGLASDHFNFHVQKLVEMGFVEKPSRGKYTLTVKGKEHANKLDTDNNTIERQPKVAVMLIIESLINGKKHYIMQERLKQPYYGFWGFPTGKIRWGETIIETAERELIEETGLTAEYKICGLHHEIVYQQENNDLLEDKMFFIIHCTNIQGKLKEKFEGGRNNWLSIAEIKNLKKVFGQQIEKIEITQGKKQYIELRSRYSKDDF
jgi:8-oxo-dGTP pyrophosphatase MutT (NUDIX family)